MYHPSHLMSDFSFMRSGTGGFVKQQPDVDFEFLRKISSIMKVLLAHAVRTAERFAKACARTQITATDTRLALKFEAHEFFLRPDLETQFASALQEEQQHTYETSESESDGAEEMATDEQEEFHTNFHGPPSERGFYEKAMRYDAEWEEWQPDDQVQQLIKRAVDNIPLNPSSSEEEEGEEEGDEEEEDDC